MSLDDPTGALAELDLGDQLHMIHPVTDTTAAENPFSTRPGDLVYEAEDVNFNLSAASRCLEETRRTVEAMREGNRHRRSDDTGPASGPRSRSRSRGDDAGRPRADQTPRSPHNHLVDPKPSMFSAWQCMAGKVATLSPLTLSRSQVVHNQPSTLPQMSKKVRRTGAPVAHAGLSPSSQLQHQHTISDRYLHAATASQALPGTATSEARLGPPSTLISAPCLVARLLQGLGRCLQQVLCVLSSAFNLSHIRFPSCHSSGSHECSASPPLSTYSRPGPNSRGSPALCIHQLIRFLCLHPACAGSWAEARVAAHATEAAGGTMFRLTDLPASMPKLGGLPFHDSSAPQCAPKAQCQACIPEGLSPCRPFRAHQVQRSHPACD